MLAVVARIMASISPMLAYSQMRLYRFIPMRKANADRVKSGLSVMKA